MNCTGGCRTGGDARSYCLAWALAAITPDLRHLASFRGDFSKNSLQPQFGRSLQHAERNTVQVLPALINSPFYGFHKKTQ
jgi:hypothetical protein